MRGWWMPAVRPASANKKGRLTSSCIMSTETVRLTTTLGEWTLQCKPVQ